jgi:hypothetical protein
LIQESIEKVTKVVDFRRFDFAEPHQIVPPALHHRSPVLNLLDHCVLSSLLNGRFKIKNRYRTNPHPLTTHTASSPALASKTDLELSASLSSCFYDLFQHVSHLLFESLCPDLSLVCFLSILSIAHLFFFGFVLDFRDLNFVSGCF